MSADRGYYRLYRGWMDHPVLRADHAPFNRREAWVWLIEEAAWRPCPATCGRTRLTLARGQMLHSNRYLGKAWNWNDAKVRRFLGALQADAMIVSVTDAHSTLITICNYDLYQGSEEDTVAPTVAPTVSRPSRDNLATISEVKNSKNLKNLRKEEEERVPDLNGLECISGGLEQPSDPEILHTAEVVHLPPDPCELAMAAWNDMASSSGLTPVRSLSRPRRDSLRNRLRECGGIDGWRAALRQVTASDFLLGSGDRGWKASFDFIIKQSNFTKLREGVYGNRGRGRRPGSRMEDWADVLGPSYRYQPQEPDGPNVGAVEGECEDVG